MSIKEDLVTNKVVIEKLRPHYIFNVLWSIQYLIKHDPNKAEKMLSDFSSFLRGKISDITHDSLVDFETEMEQTIAYIEIENVRSSNGVKYELDLDYVDFEIAPLVMQPLVENAIKHGIFNHDNTGTVKISSHKEGNLIRIVVEDDGVGFDIEDLDEEKCNDIFKIENRLKVFYKDAKVVYDSSKGNGTKVTITFTQN